MIPKHCKEKKKMEDRQTESFHLFFSKYKSKKLRTYKLTARRICAVSL